MPKTPHPGNALAEYAGNRVAEALRRLVVEPARPTDVADVQAWLTGPLTLAVKCDPDSDYKHTLHVPAANAEGTCTISSPADHSWGDLAGEMMMAALASRASTCLLVWSVLETGTVAFGSPAGTPSKITRSTRGSEQIERDAIILAVARAWTARDPHLNVDARTFFLTYSVFPNTWDAWVAAGVTFEQARPFLMRHVPLNQALPWVREGLSTKQAVNAALRGRVPTSDADWVLDGVSSDAVQAWRTHTDCTPAQVQAFAAAGLGPRQAATALGSMSPEEVLAYARIGVPGRYLTSWGAVPVDIAAVLYRGRRSPWWWGAFQSARPHRSGVKLRDVTAAEIDQWLRLGFKNEQTLGQIIDGPVLASDVAVWGGKPPVSSLLDAPSRRRFVLPYVLPVVKVMSAAEWRNYLKIVDDDPRWLGEASDVIALITEVIDAHVELGDVVVTLPAAVTA